MLYRIALTFAGQWLNKILEYIDGHPFRILGWFVILILLAVMVGWLVKWEPMISGSGIPQVEGEVLGKLSQNWKRVLPAKFAGGFSVCWAASLSEEKARPSSLELWEVRGFPGFSTGERRRRDIS